MSNIEKNGKSNPDHQEKQENKMKIIVNGRDKVPPKRTLTFEDVVKLAFDNTDFNNPDIAYTVTYTHIQTDRKGSLVAGKEVNIEDGMVFSVTKTDKS